MVALAAVGKLTLARLTARVSMLTPQAYQFTLLTVCDVTTHFVLGDHNVLGYGLLVLVV